MEYIEKEVTRFWKLIIHPHVLEAISKMDAMKDSLSNFSTSIQSLFTFFISGKLFRDVYVLYKQSSQIKAKKLAAYHLYGHKIARDLLESGEFGVRTTSSAKFIIRLRNFQNIPPVVVAIPECNPNARTFEVHDIFFITHVCQWYDLSGNHLDSLDGFTRVWKCTSTKLYLSRPSTSDIILYDVKKKTFTKMSRDSAPARNANTKAGKPCFNIETRHDTSKQFVDRRNDKNIVYNGLPVDIFQMHPSDLISLNGFYVHPDNLRRVFDGSMDPVMINFAGDFVLLSSDLQYRTVIVFNKVTYTWREVVVEASLFSIERLEAKYIRVDTSGKVYVNTKQKTDRFLVNVENMEECTPFVDDAYKWTMNKTCIFLDVSNDKIHVYHRKKGRFLKQFYVDPSTCTTHTTFGMHSEHYLRSDNLFYDLNVQNKEKLSILLSVFGSNIVSGVKKYIFF